MKRVMWMLILLIVIFMFTISSSYAFELNGFADVSYTKSVDAPKDAEFRNGDFAFGALDLYLAESLEDIEILVELIVEFGDVLDLERLTLGYTFSDALKIRAGRFHTPLGFWNTSYHHGVQLQPTILRPEFLNFEDDHGILPIHVVGAYLTGRARTAAGVLEYGGVVGNGAKVTGHEEGGANILNPNNVEDNSIGKAIAFHVALLPAMVDGLKVGLSGHVARVQNDDDAIDDTDPADLDGDTILDEPDGLVDNPVDVDQTILSVAITYSIDNVNLAGEYFSIKDENNAGSGSDTSNAYYGLMTYTLKDRWIPYLMYENMSVKEDDPYFISLGTEDVTKTTLGLRYNISYRSSVKGEIRAVDKGNSDWNEFAVQWALAF